MECPYCLRIYQTEISLGAHIAVNHLFKQSAGQKITMVTTCLDAKDEWLFQCLDSGKHFKKILLHIDSQTKEKPTFDLGQFKNVELFEYPAHLGIEEALNLMATRVQTEWVTFLMSDDFFNEKPLLNLLEDFEEYSSGVDVVNFPCTVLNQSGSKGSWGSASNVTLNDLKQGNMVTFSSFQRTKVLWRVGGYSEKIPFSDWHYWLKVKKAGFKFRLFNQEVYTFRFGHFSAARKQEQQFGYENAKRMILEDIERFNQ